MGGRKLEEVYFCCFYQNSVCLCCTGIRVAAAECGGDTTFSVTLPRKHVILFLIDCKVDVNVVSLMSSDFKIIATSSVF